MHGQFNWYELQTSDPDGAKAFYPRFTGWGTMPFDADYTMWTSGGAPVAGLFRLTGEMRAQGVPPNWMPYVESRDVDETAARAGSLGGRVLHGPADIPGTGRFAVLQDPQGAVFGIYRSATGGGAWDGTAVVGRFSWHELMTTERAKALEFYRALFGWEKQAEMDMGGGNMYAIFGQGQAMYGGVYDRPPAQAGMPPFWMVYIHVKDVGKAVDIATRAGATVHRARMDVPDGTIAILGDPQGAAFALHDTVKTGTVKTGMRRTGTGKTGTKKSGTRKAGTKKSGTKKAGTKKSGTRKSGTRKSGTRKAGTKKAGTRKAGTRKAGTKKAGTRKAGTRKPVRRAGRR